MDDDGGAFDHSDQQQSGRWKGKGRAPAQHASETTPLLVTSSTSLIRDDTPSTSSRSRRRLYVLLSTVFFTTLCICIAALLIIALIAYSYSSKVSNISVERLLDHAVVLDGPQRIDVLNATDGVFWIHVDARVGIDADAALDTLVDGDSAFLQRWVGRWVIRKVHTVVVNSSEIVLETKVESARLSIVSLPPIRLPLTCDRPSDLSWLSNISMPMRVSVTSNTSVLETFARTSWKHGFADVDARIADVSVSVGSTAESGWKRRLRTTLRNIGVSVHYRLPHLPGIPTPGKNAPFPNLASLITLDKFYVATHNHNISITANATAVNPFPESINMKIPEIPFIISLSNSSASHPVNKSAWMPVVTGHSQTFELTHPNITVDVSASLLQLDHLSLSSISAFVSQYLRGHSVPFLAGTPLLPSLKVPMDFPAPHPKPQVLRDVAIRNMHISLNGEVVMASGTIFARVVLPLGIRLKIDVERIWPDVLVYDGKVPDEAGIISLGSSVDPEGVSNTKSGGSDIPRPPLPDPLPEGAFARIRPGDWLPADSIALPIPNENGSFDEGTSEYIVTADVENVPLEVLPGRQKLMRSFVAKVLFGPQGALAGVQGIAAIGASVDGLPLSQDGRERDGVVEMQGLPFTGSFRVGKKGL